MPALSKSELTTVLCTSKPNMAISEGWNIQKSTQNSNAIAFPGS